MKKIRLLILALCLLLGLLSCSTEKTTLATTSISEDISVSLANLKLEESAGEKSLAVRIKIDNVGERSYRNFGFEIYPNKGAEKFFALDGNTIPIGHYYFLPLKDAPYEEKSKDGLPISTGFDHTASFQIKSDSDLMAASSLKPEQLKDYLTGFTVRMEADDFEREVVLPVTLNE